MQKFFFHIHIWKCAGATFLNICRNNFGKGFHRDIMLVQDWVLSIQQLRWLMRYHKWIRCYSCHMLSGDLPYEAEDTEVIGVAFVRNPVDRFISSYSYQKAANYRGGFAKGKSFSEFYVHALEDVDNPMWRNGQTYVLGGSRSEEALARIQKRMQQGRLILLVTERFDESCIALEGLFPDQFKDCSYIRRNVSPQKELITRSQRSAVSQHMHLDYKLLSLANDYLDATLERLFPDLHERQQYLDDFRQRCWSKEKYQRRFDAVKSFESAIKTAVKTVIRL